MMRPFILSLFLFLALGKVNAQVATIPFEFTSEDDNRLLRENDSLKYYMASGDTTGIVCIDEEASFYKLFNKAHKLIADGAFITDGDKYQQEGKWTERYDNGKTRITGYYNRGQPIGTWQEFYATGKMKTIYNYAIINDNGIINTCLSGSYQEYYPDGKLKVNGFYSATVDKVTDTLMVEDPITQSTVYKAMVHAAYKPEKTGHWEYYTESGELDKKEDSSKVSE